MSEARRRACGWPARRQDGTPGARPVRGELDNDTLPTAQDEVSAAEAQAPPVLVLDLAALEYVDSCGVRLVLLAQDVADDENRRLAVRLGHGQTRRMFDMLGITDRLEVLDREEPPS